MTQPNFTRTEFRHIYWIGGSPCSGKSTIAQALADRFGLVYFNCDAAFYRHQARITAAEQPTFHKISQMNWESIWMRPVEEQVADELDVYREEFPLILSDLRALGRDRPVVAEGAALLPECVAPLLADPRRAVWVVPSPAFQLEHYRRREWAQGIVAACKNPDQAFNNWMNRDIAFGSQVLVDATARGLHTRVVDGQANMDENIHFVQALFQLERTTE